MSFFDLEHIFIVFSPGAGGNFVTGILTRTLYRDFSNIRLSSTGNAHSLSPDKLIFSDVMSCGMRYDVPKFYSAQEKLEYCRNAIESKHGNDTDIKISWSHDYTNIMLYKTLFPNCKILVITQDSDDEKLAIIIQQELKNRLDPNGFVFLEGNDYVEPWRLRFKHALNLTLGSNMSDISTEIANNYMAPEYKNIVTFFAINMMLAYYGVEYLTDPRKPLLVDYLEYCTLPRFVEYPSYVLKTTDKVIFTVGPSYKDCITDDCVLMPYHVLMKNDLNAFVKMIESLIGSLDHEQIEFVENNLTTYITKQAPGLMSNPTQYYRNLGKATFNDIQNLKAQSVPPINPI